MTLARAQPVRFSPAGLSDSLDETDLFPGAMASLQNLIPDPSTKNVWTCRPGSTLETSFAGFTTPGFVSVYKVVGSYVYGMVASGLTAGKDQPFAFDLVTGAFVTVTGVTAANVPTTQASIGDWTPPTMDLIGVNLVVTHPGFDGVTNFFGWFDLTNPLTPHWHAGNLASPGAIESLGTITGGATYVNGTYLNVPLTVSSGTAGSGATADIVVSGGAVTSVYIDTFGHGYDNTSVLTASNANLGGSGSGFTVSVTAVYAGLIVLTTIPTWVRQFNQRAWFGINPLVGQPSTPFTDVLALNATNANQALTYGDNLPLTAAYGLPLQNQLGGIIQSLMVFKGASFIEQVTGDYSASDLDVNSLNVATGTLSPRSIVGTPKGVAFLAPDGMRVIDFFAKVGDPIGNEGKGVTVPFLSPISPSRVAAGCNATVIRLSVENSQAPGTPTQEYWFDTVREVWSGPHTFPASMYDVYANQFVIAPISVQASLFLSPSVPSPVSSTTENGVGLTWAFQTVMIADNEQMAQSELTEFQIKTTEVAAINGMQVTVQDENANPYNTTFFTFDATGSLWGSAIWGSSLWGGGQQALYPRRIGFNAPVVYNRLAVLITGQAAVGFKIGDLFLRRRILGYLQGDFLT